MRWPWVSPKEFRGLQGNMKGLESFMSRILSQMQRIEGDLITLKVRATRSGLQPPAYVASGPVRYVDTCTLGRIVRTTVSTDIIGASARFYCSDGENEIVIQVRGNDQLIKALESAVGKRFRFDLAQVDEPKEDQNAR